MLTFIDCIPVVMRPALGVALELLFDLAFNGELNGYRYGYDVFRDDSGVLHKVIRFLGDPSRPSWDHEKGEAVEPLI